MNGYAILNSCANCQNVVQLCRHDEDTRYYCGLDAPPQPPSYNAMLGSDASTEACAECENQWDTWCEGRKVEANGYCGRWEAERDA